MSTFKSSSTPCQRPSPTSMPGGRLARCRIGLYVCYCYCTIKFSASRLDSSWYDQKRHQRYELTNQSVTAKIIKDGSVSKEILANQVGNNARWVNFKKKIKLETAKDGSTSAVALFRQTGSARSFFGSRVIVELEKFRFHILKASQC